MHQKALALGSGIMELGYKPSTEMTFGIYAVNKLEVSHIMIFDLDWPYFDL